MRFSGKFSPPVGSGDGVTMNMRMPGIRFTIACTSGRIWKTVRFRSPHGLSTMPPKPDVRLRELENLFLFRHLGKRAPGHVRVK